jgi:hypothetical protein
MATLADWSSASSLLSCGLLGLPGFARLDSVQYHPPEWVLQCLFAVGKAFLRTLS